MATKLTQAEARKIVPRLKWQAAPKKTEWGDMVQASMPLGKDDTMTIYAPREMVEKLSRKPKPKSRVPDWETTRANCS